MENENAELVPAKRPQFLTVLCILTFIGAGLGLLGGFWNLIKAPTALEEIESIQSMGAMPEGGMFADMMESAVLAAQNAYPLAITAIVANLLCLLGALFMWKQRKNGFYIYVAAQLRRSLSFVGVDKETGGIFSRALATPCLILYSCVYRNS
jgi:hypothetical protein